MLITQEIINNTLCNIISMPNGNIFTIDGFEMLAEWSERQEWWKEFVELIKLGPHWRSAYKSDPYWFAIMLFHFVSNSRYAQLP